MKFKNNWNIWLSLMNCAVVMSFLTFIGISALLYNRPLTSDVEKRELSKMPVFSVESYFNGDYNRKMSEFVADTFPFREKLIKLAGKISLYKGFVFENIRIHNTANSDLEYVHQDEGDDTEIPSKNPEKKIDNASIDSSPAPKEQVPEEDAIRNGAIYVYKGKGFSIFGGTEAMGKKYASAINSYDEAMGEDVQIYNLVVPSSIEFGMPERYRKLSAPQKERIENIDANLNPRVKHVDVYDIFESHKDEYLFFSTDHHWTVLGSYYAYCEFAKTAGFTPVNIDNLEKRTLTNFLGTLYAQTNDSTMIKNPDYVDYYMMPTNCEVFQYLKNSPYNPRKVSLYGEYALPVNSYSVFLHGDFPLSKIVTENKNGRKIAVVKESYGNAFVPWLVNNYEEIYVVDERYYEASLTSLIKDNSIDDVLFINNIFAAYSSFHINNIIKIKDQVYIPYVPPVASESEEKSSAVESVSDINSNTPASSEASIDEYDDDD